VTAIALSLRYTDFKRRRWMSVASLIPRMRKAWINLSPGSLVSLHGPVADNAAAENGFANLSKGPDEWVSSCAVP
jgi:hypothetical protein